MLSYAASPAFAGLQGRSLALPSPSQGEPLSIRAELYSSLSGYCSWQSMSELDSRAPPPVVSKTRPETRSGAGTGSYKRLHLSHPHLYRKIVQKARRALSKLGRKPGSKTCRSSNAVSVVQDSAPCINSAQDASLSSADPSGTASYELPAGDGIVHGLPAEKVVAGIAAVYEV